MLNQLQSLLIRYNSGVSTAAIATAVSVGAVLATAVFGSLAARRAQFDRVIDVIGFASGGEVAGARHRIGNVRYGTGAVVHDQAVEDLFTLLWAFTRIDAVRRTLPSISKGPRALLRECVQPWAFDWYTNDLDLVRERIDAGRPEGLEKLDLTWSLNALRALSEWH